MKLAGLSLSAVKTAESYIAELHYACLNQWHDLTVHEEQ